MSVPSSKPTAERLLAWAAAACWLAAWFMPVTDGIAGWEAFEAAILASFRNQYPARGEFAITSVASALTNVVFVLLFLQWARGRDTRPTLFAKIALICVIINLFWLVEMLRSGERSGLLAGYYVWLASFALLVAVGVSRARCVRKSLAQ